MKYLNNKGVVVSKRGVANFIKRFFRRTIAQQPDNSSKTKIMEDIQRVVEQQMRHDDETTASQLNLLLTSLGYSLDLRTILRCRTALGWTFEGSVNCQLIRNVNKTKWLKIARVHRYDRFDDVIFTDECSMQLESHYKQCCLKQENQQNKPRLVIHASNNLEAIYTSMHLALRSGAYELVVPPQEYYRV